MTKTTCIDILIIACLVITISTSLCISKKSNDFDGITAKEGYSKALEEAYKWNQTAKVLLIRKNSEVISGKASEWRYEFGVIDENNKNDSIDIVVHEDGTIERSNPYWSGPYEFEIGKWEIDSDEAYNNAIKTPEIKNYLNKYGKSVHIDSFGLRTCAEDVEYKNKTVWGIAWYGDVTGDEDYKGARIEIDANTGEVLYVKADK